MILKNPKIISLEELAEKEMQIRWELKKRTELIEAKKISKFEIYQQKLIGRKLIGRKLNIYLETKKEEKQFYLGYTPVNPNLGEIVKDALSKTILNPRELFSENQFKKRMQKNYLKLDLIGTYFTMPKGFYLDSFLELIL